MNYIEEHIEFIHKYEVINKRVFSIHKYETVNKRMLFLNENNLETAEKGTSEDISKHAAKKRIKDIHKDYERVIKDFQELHKEISLVTGEKLSKEYELFIEVIVIDIEYVNLLITATKERDLIQEERAEDVKNKTIDLFQKMLARMKNIIDEDNSFDKNTKQKIINDKLLEQGYKPPANTLKYTKYPNF